MESPVLLHSTSPTMRQLRGEDAQLVLANAREICSRPSKVAIDHVKLTMSRQKPRSEKSSADSAALPA
jgi:hypothetical protein